jgi:hypothetical protein
MRHDLQAAFDRAHNKTRVNEIWKGFASDFDVIGDDRQHRAHDMYEKALERVVKKVVAA